MSVCRWWSFHHVLVLLTWSGFAFAGWRGELAVAADVSRGGGPSLQLENEGYIIDFRNRIPGVLDAPVRDENGRLLEGSQYVAQLYRFAESGFPGEAIPVGEPRPFGAGAEAGYWVPDSDPRIRVPAASAGCCMEFQVRVWDARAGARFETAGSGRRGVSLPFRYFRGAATRVMDALGFLTLQEYEAPGVVVRQPGDATVWVKTGGDVSRQPLEAPGFLGQLYLQTNLFDVDFKAGRGGVPAGPVAPVQHQGPRAGWWEVDPNQILSGLPVALARWRGQPGSSYSIQLRVWDSAVGATYEDCLRRGGQTGFVLGVSTVSLNEITLPSEVFTAFPRLLSAPEIVVLGQITLSSANRTVVVPPGLGLFTNPTTNHVVPQLNLTPFFSEVVDGLLVYHFDAARQSYRMSSYYDLWYTDPAPYFAPGEGFFVFNPSTRPTSLLFPGANGPLPALVRPTGVAGRFYCRGNTLGRMAGWRELTGLAPTEGDAVFRLQGGVWQVNAYTFGAWDQGEPVVPADEAVFIRLQP